MLIVILLFSSVNVKYIFHSNSTVFIQITINNLRRLHVLTAVVVLDTRELKTTHVSGRVCYFTYLQSHAGYYARSVYYTLQRKVVHANM